MDSLMGISIKEAYIVIVEDDPNAQMVTLDLLRLAGADRCYMRKSVPTAVSFAERLPQVDLFLVDINMPGQSGYDLLEIVRAHTSLNSGKIVAVTAGTLEEDVQKARDLGFDGFISKPLKAAQFANQVQRILDGEAVWDWR
jgi:two-component system cell cycle response regulator DivK